MRAKVTQVFKGKDNASPRCLQYEVDQLIDSPIADTAVENGWAESCADDRCEGRAGQQGRGKARPRTSRGDPHAGRTPSRFRCGRP